MSNRIISIIRYASAVIIQNYYKQIPVILLFRLRSSPIPHHHHINLSTIKWRTSCMSINYENANKKWRRGICRLITSVPIAGLTVLMFASIGPANAADTVPAGLSTQAAHFIKVGSRADYRYRKVVKHGVVYYCKRETVTGSRLQRNEICLTEKQREMMEDASQQDLRNLQRPAQDNKSNPPMGPGT